jgi:hypothetical protein
MTENQMADNMRKFRVKETLEFLRDLNEMRKLYGDKIYLDKSLYFHNHPKEDYL